MKMLRASLLASVLLVLLAGELRPLTSAQEAPPKETSWEEVMAEREARLQELRRALDQDSADGALWEQLIAEEGMYRTLQARLSGRLEQVGAEERNAWQWNIVEQVIGEWMARQPKDPAPHLVLARYFPTAEGRLAILEETISRFPAAASAHGALARELQRRGENARASELLEGFVSRHPEDPLGFNLLWHHHQRQGNVALADAVLASWLDHHPSDLAALDAWFGSAVARHDQDRAREIAHRILAQVNASQSALSLCEDLEGPFGGAFVDLAAECFGRVAAAAADDENVRLRAIEGYGRAMGVTGATGDLLTAVEKLPEDRRPRAMLYAAMAMANQQQCREAVAFFERVADHHDEELSFPTHIARSLTYGCGHTDAARQLVLHLLGRGDPQDVRQIAASWQELLPHDQLCAVLRQRLEHEPAADALWQALDEFYEATADERRYSHLQAWIERHPRGGADRWLDLANLHLVEGELDHAIATLESALAQGRGHNRIVETLAGLLLMTGDLSRAEALANELLAQESEWATQQGLLLRARLLAARDDPERSLELYDEYFATRTGAAAEPVREYAALLAGLGRGQEAAAFLDERFRELTADGGVIGGREAYLATELEAVGLQEQALGLFLQASERAPEDAGLLMRIGRLASELGRWAEAEDATRRLIGLNPGDAGHWSRLAEIFVTQGDLGALQALAVEAREATGELPSRIGYFLGQDALERGDLLQAIELLRDAQQSSPYDPDISSALVEAYKKLGRNHG